MKKINKSENELLLELERLKNENETLKLKFQNNWPEQNFSDEELQKSNLKLSAIISASPDGIGTITLDGKMQFISKKLAEMYGYSNEQKDEFIGKPVIDFVDPTYHAKLMNNVRKLLEQEREYSLNEYLVIKKDGTRFYAEVNSTLIKDSNGKPESILLVERDITERKRKEEELQQSNEKWEALIAASPDGIGMISVDGKIQLISDKLIRMHGYDVEPKGQYYGRSVFDFIDPSSHASLIENTRKLLSGTLDEKPREYLALKKDKSQFIIDVQTSVLYDVNGHPKSILYVERDITARKQAEEALQLSSKKLEAIIAASPDGIGIISLDGTMQLFSDKLAEMYGYSVENKEEIIGKKASYFIDESDHPRLISNIRKLISREKDFNLSEYLAIKKDGSRFFVEVNSTVLFDSNSKPQSILFVERDITDRKRVDDEIKQKNRELSQLNATKDKFFSIIAHDLKSPFQALLGYSEILSNQFPSLTEEEKISFINSVDNLSHSAYRLLENLLQWSRMQTGQMKIELEDFNLLAELYPTLSLVNQTALNKNIEFRYVIDNSLFIKADSNMLSAVVRNLVSNAIKFTNKGGKIVLTAQKYTDFIEFSVKDTGIGIEKENLEKLFKVDANLSREGTANEKGTGLGLLLCREMIAKHGGEIRVESELNKGSVFSFTIPSK